MKIIADDIIRGYNCTPEGISFRSRYGTIRKVVAVTDCGVFLHWNFLQNVTDFRVKQKMEALAKEVG